MKHLYALWLLVIFLAAASIVALIQVQEVQSHQNDALRSIMCRAEAYVIQHKAQETPQQVRNALQFYDQALAGANLAPCSNPQ